MQPARSIPVTPASVHDDVALGALTTTVASKTMCRSPGATKLYYYRSFDLFCYPNTGISLLWNLAYECSLLCWNDGKRLGVVMLLQPQAFSLRRTIFFYVTDAAFVQMAGEFPNKLWQMVLVQLPDISLSR